ncbi:binding partner of ACD11 1 isoform X2 [Sesamum indicum]|uniref:Binding partner of ACD11 1 isoform X2 n=1 Tax=Sesamum indicum TaxID=4182 RepID=A0A6I9SM43_SESIN|nr:binding partner of ACD11 1 isoform X2 [Sesamum indicum]
MNPTGYTVEISNLSPNATEKDVYDFFAFCGAIQHVVIVRAGEFAFTAYVTFKNPHAVETAILVDGATILDRPVCITRSGHYGGDHNLWNHSSLKIEDENQPSSQGQNVVPSAGKAVCLAQDVVKSVAAKGYVLGKGALNKAKAFDESHQVSATAVAKVTQLSERVGLTDKIAIGVQAARAADQRYHISNTTRSVVSATGKRTASAANAMANSSYFSKGALWLSGALSRASQVAADLGGRGVGK